METEFSAVDALTMAASAAGMMRSSGDAEAALANAYAALGIEKPNAAGPLALRIVQLILDAGPNRKQLYDYLRRIEGPFSWCRPLEDDIEAEPGPQDAEAQRYLQLLRNGELGARHEMFWRGDSYPYFPSFRLLERSAVESFDGPVVVVREGKAIDPADAAPPRTGDTWECQPLDLPIRTKGLIDYPFEIATLFEIETGPAPWDVWAICCAFADQYMKLYEAPLRYGIWGHDLSELWIENLIYYPEHQLIYPEVGS